jgi:hypothetical protein
MLPRQRTQPLLPSTPASMSSSSGTTLPCGALPKSLDTALGKWPSCLGVQHSTHTPLHLQPSRWCSLSKDVCLPHIATPPQQPSAQQPSHLRCACFDSASSTPTVVGSMGLGTHLGETCCAACNQPHLCSRVVLAGLMLVTGVTERCSSAMTAWVHVCGAGHTAWQPQLASTAPPSNLAPHTHGRPVCSTLSTLSGNAVHSHRGLLYRAIYHTPCWLAPADEDCCIPVEMV